MDPDLIAPNSLIIGFIVVAFMIRSSLKYTCIYSRSKKQTTFSGPKNSGKLRVNLLLSIMNM